MTGTSFFSIYKIDANQVAYKTVVLLLFISLVHKSSGSSSFLCS